MKKRTLLAFTIAIAPLAACGSKAGSSSGSGAGMPMYTPFSLPANTYSHGDPTPKEQALLELVQRVRADPPTEGKRVVDLPEVQGAIAQFGVNKAQVVNDFMGYMPVPPFAFDPKLHDSALFHSNDMSTNQFQDHTGSKGDTFDQRITNAGYKWSAIEENIFAHAKDVEECNAAFLIDWGNPDLGHRKALLDLESQVGRIRDIGIAIVENTKSAQVGPLVVTQDFGFPIDSTNRYLVGVVYKDDNMNGLYDEGEGVAGMKIVPDHGDTYAITSTSGGFAIPFKKGLGAFKVQVQNDGGEALDQKDAEIQGENTKVDFIVQ